jgi:hypothetical protein
MPRFDRFHVRMARSHGAVRDRPLVLSRSSERCPYLLYRRDTPALAPLASPPDQRDSCSGDRPPGMRAACLFASSAGRIAANDAVIERVSEVAARQGRAVSSAPRRSRAAFRATSSRAAPAFRSSRGTFGFRRFIAHLRGRTICGPHRSSDRRGVSSTRGGPPISGMTSGVRSRRRAETALPQ